MLLGLGAGGCGGSSGRKTVAVGQTVTISVSRSARRPSRLGSVAVVLASRAGRQRVRVRPLVCGRTAARCGGDLGSARFESVVRPGEWVRVVGPGLVGLVVAAPLRRTGWTS